MKTYLVYNYTDKEDRPAVLEEVVEKKLFELLDEAKRNIEIKIAVYEIGDCLLDWS